MSGTTLAPAIGTPLPSRCVPPGTSAQVSPSLPLVPRLLRRVVRGLGNLLLLVVVLAFTGLAVGPHVLGYRTMTMLTGSMAPGINPGDVTVAVQEPTSALAVGQIISYQIPVDDHRVVSHRVVKVTRGPGGAVVVQTKGDHNPSADPWTAIITDPQVWTVRAVVPHLGDVIRTLRGPGLHIAFLYVGPALLTVLLLSEIWRSPKAGARSAVRAADCLRARHRRAQRPRRRPRRRQPAAHVPRPVDQHADRPGLRPAGRPRG